MEKSSNFPFEILRKFEKSLLGKLDFELWKHEPTDKGKIKIYAKCKHCPSPKFVAADNQSLGNLAKHLKKSHAEEHTRFLQQREEKQKSVPKGQPKLDHLITGTTQGTKVLLDKLIMKYIVNGIRPLSTVEDADFRALLRAAVKDDKVTFMNRKTLKAKIFEEYNIEKNRIISNLAEATVVCLTADLWSSRAKSYIGVTAHFLDSALKRKNIILACRRFRGLQTYDKIALGINQIMGDFKLPREKVVAIVTDNGKNFVKAFKEFSLDYEEPGSSASSSEVEIYSDESDDDEEGDTVPTQMPIHELLDTNLDNPYNLPPHIRCVSHTLNLVATRDVKKILATGMMHTAMGKCTKIFNLSSLPKSAETIRDICQKALKSPGSTRWNSLYDSLTDLLTVEEFLDPLCSALKISSLTKNEKSFLKEYAKISEPIATALDTLQGDQEIFLGNLLPALLGLEKNIENLRGNLKHTKNLANALLAGIRERFKTVLLVDSNAPSEFLFAAMSHPEFKLRWLPADKREEFKTVFIQRCIELNSSDFNNQVETNEKNDSNENDQVSKPSKSLYVFYDNDNNDSSEICKAQLECLQYFDDKCNNITVLKKYPTVENMFRRYNTCLPSSASAERLFSAAGLILSPRRNRLGDEIFNTLVFLKCNKNFTEN